MEDKMTIKNIKVLNEVAFIHSHRLDRMGDIIDKDCATSLKYLNAIYSAGPVDVYDAMIETFATVKQNHSKVSSSAYTPSFFDCYIVWARMYVIGYFTMYEDEFWRKTILPKMYELIPQPALRGEISTIVKYIDKYYKDKQQWMVDSVKAGAPSPDDFAVFIENEELKNRVVELEKELKKCKETTPDTDIIKEKDDKIADLQQQIADKDARIKELEALLAHPHLSFIETEGKSPQKIQWAYEDIANSIKRPSTMAVCLLDLQIKDMLKGQDRYGDLENIKAIYEELKEIYGFTWTYAALCKAINKAKAKKQIH